MDPCKEGLLFSPPKALAIIDRTHQKRNHIRKQTLKSVQETIAGELEGSRCDQDGHLQQQIYASSDPAAMIRLFNAVLSRYPSSPELSDMIQLFECLRSEGLSQRLGEIRDAIHALGGNVPTIQKLDALLNTPLSTGERVLLRPSFLSRREVPDPEEDLFIPHRDVATIMATPRVHSVW